MTSELVSVVVPVFNTVGFLGRCITSIMLQSHRNIEIICVDDGSTDGSSRILAEFALADDRLVVLSQANRGVSDARNLGLTHAKGEYVLFVDADDHIDRDLVATYLSYMTGECDLVMEGAKTFNVHDKSSKIDFLYRTMRTEAINGPCGKLYRREFLARHNICFPSGISLGEDLLFNLEYFRHVRAVSHIPHRLYLINSREGSLTRSYRPSKYIDLMKVHDTVRQYVQSCEIDNFEALLNYLRIKALVSCANSALGAQSFLDAKAARTWVRNVEKENGRLRVPTGDLQMVVVGVLYNSVGLLATSTIIRRGKQLASLVGWVR